MDLRIDVGFVPPEPSQGRHNTGRRMLLSVFELPRVLLFAGIYNSIAREWTGLIVFAYLRLRSLQRQARIQRRAPLVAGGLNVL
jgi:hypothetical protein